MESFKINSKIVENGKEFFIQTINDDSDGAIKTTILENGELLDVNIVPYSEDIRESDIIKQIKSTHQEKMQELEYLFSSYKDILQSGQIDPMFHLGTTLYFKRLYLEAQQLFKMAIKLNENFHEAYFFLSKTNLAMDHIEDAIDAADKAVALQPQYADYRNNLGEAFLAAKSCKRAAVEFEKAITSNVYYADAYFNLALTYVLNAIVKEDYELSEEMISKCRDYLKKAVLIYPDFQTPLYNEAMSVFRKGDLKLAYDFLLNVREQKKEKIRQEKLTHYNRFLIYSDWLSQESLVERINSLENQLNKNPNYVDLYYDLAVCYLQLAKFDWKKGLYNLQKALEIHPRFKKVQKAMEIAKKHFSEISDAVTTITREDE